ncbi:NAD(P)/FAD-dependent oxidoreductase [Streptomyces sp. NPDC048297]|uniref:NAD(P)/FAD-dependent oxidoreductase n=1 Tax=Streptomyces sp. NPDC048297 TaxID=3365531 RepID=UPI00371C12DD
MTRPYNVLVVGGGPAGSVTATLLAQHGMNVRLLESARFPRYHIGESLTPATRQVLELIGAAELLDAGGYQVKRGGVFHWGSDNWTIDWSKLFGDSVRTWQVDRAEFDALLLANAAAKGVEVREQVAAKSVEFDETGRPTAVTCVPENGDPYVLNDFDFLIDASGRAGLLSVRHLRNRQQHSLFRNVALWGYWKGARLLPGSPEGGVNVVSSPQGWYWVIPLHGGRMSVGLVTHKDLFAERRRAAGSLDELYHSVIQESDTVRDLLSGAEQMDEVRAETDYSYVADRFCGPGYMLIGDSACFLDPLLSTGVHLALHGALVGAASLLSAHRGEVSEAEGLSFFEASYRRAYTRMLALVSSMYESYHGMNDFFWTAHRLARPDAGSAPGGDGPASFGSADFGEIIAGMSDLREVRDATTRVTAATLTAEADRVEEELHTRAGQRPAFDALRATPQSDAALLGLRLVSEPALGLVRVPVDDDDHEPAPDAVVPAQASRARAVHDKMS